jgi:methionyl-tRNA formyltransferase
MPEPSIITVPNQKLFEVASKVTSFGHNSKELKKQIEKMVEILRREGGVGLAANQLGYGNRVVVVEFKDTQKNQETTEIPLTIFLNPEIIEYGKEWECLEEGCLSIPKIELEVERPSQIKIKYQDINGKKIKAAPKGLLARILQHEIDHLNGIIFTQRLREQFFQKFPEFKKLKIAFFGSGEFSSLILEGLILLGFNLNIYTENAKPAGRKRQTQPTAVAEVAKKFGQKYREISNFKFLISNCDLIICADFGQKIPSSILNQAKITAINIHPSLLPKYIGPSPIQTAILNGDKKTGVSIIKMTDKIDEGPLYAQMETEILADDTYPQLRDRLATLGLKLLVKTLPAIVRREIEPVKQDLTQATRTRKFTKADGEIDWKKSPKKIAAQIRALYPWPGSYTFIDGKRLIIHRAHCQPLTPLQKRGRTGSKLVLDLVQSEGKKPMKFADFWRGYKGPKPEWLKKVDF